MQRQDDRFFGYDWEVEGVRARFFVDLSVAEFAPDAMRTLLVTLSFESGDPNRDSMTPAEAHKAEALHEKCKKRLPLLYVGSIALEAQRVYYYYAASEEEHEGVEAVVSKEKHLVCTVESRLEPRYTTYFKLLYPDAAKAQTVKNRDMTALLKRQGDAVSPPRRVNLTCCFFTENERLGFEAEAREDGFVLGKPFYQPEQKKPHCAVLHRMSSLNDVDIDALTTRTIRIAERHGGELMRWDCQFVPKKAFR